MQTTISSSFAAAITGSQYPLVSWIVGRPEGFGVLRERECRDALGGHPLHLLDGQWRIPHGDQHQRDVPARRRATPLLDQPVVVVLQALEAELAVARFHEQLATEARKRREAERCQDSRAVHVFEASLGVVTAGTHFSVRQRFGTELLLRLSDDSAETGGGEVLAVVDPDLQAVHGFHVWCTVTVLRRYAVHPEVRRLQNVVVDRDQPVKVQCIGHFSSPIAMCFTSWNSRMPSVPRSRPRPLCL